MCLSLIERDGNMYKLSLLLKSNLMWSYIQALKKIHKALRWPCAVDGASVNKIIINSLTQHDNVTDLGQRFTAPLTKQSLPDSGRKFFLCCCWEEGSIGYDLTKVNVLLSVRRQVSTMVPLQCVPVQCTLWLVIAKTLNYSYTSTSVCHC